MDLTEQRFNELRQKIGNEILNITEVYVNHSQQNLVYRPITNITIGELINGRERLTKQAELELVAIELELNKATEVHPANRSLKGRFQLAKWLNPDFSPGQVPENVNARKRTLEKDSGWLHGGPGERKPRS